MAFKQIANGFLFTLRLHALASCYEEKCNDLCLVYVCSSSVLFYSQYFFLIFSFHYKG